MNAVGMVEVLGLVKAIDVADQCLKAANVNLIGIDKVSGGRLTVKIVGDVGAVKSSVEAVTTEGVISSTVIPYMYDEVLELLRNSTKNVFRKAKAKSCLEPQKTETPVVETTEPKIEASEKPVAQVMPAESKTEEENMIENGQLQMGVEPSVTESLGAESVVTELVENSQNEAEKTVNSKEFLSQKTVKELVELAVSQKKMTYKDAKRLKRSQLIDLLSE